MNQQSRAKLEELIDAHGFGKHKAAFLAATSPAVRLTTEPTDDGSIPLGATRFGGLPDIPPGMPWPTVGERPLAFLAQIRLSDMPHDAMADWPLPRSGRLSFWYDTAREPWGFSPDDRAGFQVTWIADEASPIERRPYPEFVEGDLDEEPILDFEPFQACAVAAEPILTIDQSRLMEFVKSEEQFDAFEALREDLHGVQGEGQHRLLGHPDQIQGDMRSECQLVSNGIDCGGEFTQSDMPRIRALMAGADDWRLLLQIDSDEGGADWMWGDMGCLYYWIRRQDLERLNFSSTWGILQCS